LVNPDSELAMAVGVDKRLECRLDAAHGEAFRRRAQDSAGRASETVDEYLIGVVRGPKDDPTFVDTGGDGPPVRDPVMPAFLRDIEPLALFDARGEALVPLGDDDMI
jgi:hypothetical protein